MFFGGYSRPKFASPFIKDLLYKVQPDLEAKINGGKRFSVCMATTYRVQNVVGKNYKIKVKTDNGYIECLVHKSLENQVKLISVAQGQSPDSMR